MNSLIIMLNCSVGIGFPLSGAFEEATTSDSAFSDVSSKPQDPPPPSSSRKSTGKTLPPSTAKWKTDKGRSSTSSNLPLPSTATTHNSRLPQPRAFSGRPSARSDLVKKDTTAARPTPPTKVTSAQKVQQPRPRVSSTGLTDKRAIPSPSVIKGNFPDIPTPMATKSLKIQSPSTPLSVSSKVTRTSVPVSTVKKKSAKTESRIEKPQRKSLSFRASSSCSTTSNEDLPQPPPLIDQSPVPVPVSPPIITQEALTEILENFSEIKEHLIELQVALQESDRSAAEKDHVIASLRAELSSLENRKCPCGRSLRRHSSSAGAQDDPDVFESDEEKVKGSIFSDCSSLGDADSPVRLEDSSHHFIVG